MNQDIPPLDIAKVDGIRKALIQHGAKESSELQREIKQN